MIPISQLENLLGYLELDLENRELDNKSDWEETYRVVKEWLDTQRSLAPRAPVQGGMKSLEVRCIICGLWHNGPCPDSRPGG
jgi:hypothetical protein